MIPHGYALDGSHAAELSVKAGSDMDMESHLYVRKLKDLVDSGKIDHKLIDDAVSRILRVKFELGLFDDPYKYLDLERENTTLVGMHTCIYLKSDNLQYDTLAPLGQWDKQTINQASDVPSIFLFHNFL